MLRVLNFLIIIFFFISCNNINESSYMENNTRGFIDNDKYISISYDDNIEYMDFDIDSCWLCNISIDNKFKDIQINDDNILIDDIEYNIWIPITLPNDKVYIKMYGNLMAEDYKFFQGYVYVPINRNELNKENRIRIILNNKVPWYIIIDNTLYELINEVKINLSINNNFNGDHNY